jgi:hypothetical protein
VTKKALDWTEYDLKEDEDEIHKAGRDGNKLCAFAVKVLFKKEFFIRGSHLLRLYVERNSKSSWQL